MSSWRWAARGVWPNEIIRTEAADGVDHAYQLAGGMMESGAVRIVILLSTPPDPSCVADQADVDRGETWTVGLDAWREKELAAISDGRA